MSELTIYKALRKGGLSPAGACALMGNMYCESLLKSNNVEDRCTLGDFDYTHAVDLGTISRYQFKIDAYGYGLCQWTYFSRKEGLYDLARQKNVSIADEEMQCEYCLLELTRDYLSLYQYLCTTTDLPEATKRICAEFERPAVNNFADRINAATRYFNQFGDSTEMVDDDVAEDPQPDIVHPEHRTSFLHLEYGDGCKRRGNVPSSAVRAWQDLLLCWGYYLGVCGADGEFGDCTKEATEKWQKDAQLLGRDVEVNGVVDEDDWRAIVEVPV